MLDVNIQRTTNGNLTFDVYRKPTHTNQYIHFNSNAPLQHKLATVRSLTRRASIIPSTDETKEKEDRRIKDALSLNGYPDWAIRQGTYKPKNILPPTNTGDETSSSSTTAAANNNSNNNSSSRIRNKGSVTLPYFAGVTEPLVRHMQKIGISATVKTRGSLREHLVHPKDKIDKLKANGVVYYHACAGRDNSPCDDNYVGESARDAATRNSEHFSTSQSAPGFYKSAIMQHAADAGHHFRREDIQILSREQDWHKRGIRESIYIRGLSPTLNRNDGRHTLPHCYDSIIKTMVKKPDSPTTHTPNETRLSTTRRGPGRPRQNHNMQTTPKSMIDETTPKSVEAQTLPKTIDSSYGMTTRSRRIISRSDQGTSDLS